MAKRRKLNKRLVILLLAFGALIVIGGVAVILMRLPKDPTIAAQRAEQAWEAGDLETAQRFLSEAIQATQKGDPSPHMYQMARLQLEWSTAPDLTRTERQQHLRSAFNYLRGALRRNPEHLEAQELLAELHWTMTRNPQAGPTAREDYIEQATSLLELDSDRPSTYFRRGLARAQLDREIGGDYGKQAMEDFRKAVDLEPEEPTYWLAMITELLRADRQQDAQQAYQQAIEANPDSAVLRVGYAEALYRQGERGRAIALCEEAVRVAPDNPTGAMALASLYTREGLHEQAIALLQNAGEAAPDNLTVHQNLAAAHMRQGDMDAAAEVLRGALELADRRARRPDVSERERASLYGERARLNAMLADALLTQARRQSDADDRRPYVAEARQAMQRIADLNPDSFAVDRIAGRIALLAGDLNVAADRLQIAMERSGGQDFDAAEALIRVYVRQDKPGKAEQIIDDLLARPQFRNSPDVMVLKAQFAMQYRDYDEAERYINRALTIDPNSARARVAKTMLALARGEASELPEDMPLSAAQIRALLTQAQELWLNGQREEAVRLLEELHARTPKDFRVVARLARMYQALDRTDRARQLLDEAIAGQANEQVRRILEVERQVLDEPDPARRLEMRLELTKAIEEPVDRLLAEASLHATYGNEQMYIQKLREAAEADPNDENVVLRIYQLAVQQENWALAEAMIERAAEANFDGVDGALWRANYAKTRGEYRQAIEHYREALKQRPDWKRVRTDLAETYVRVNDLDAAEEILTSVLDADPGYARALIAMARVSELQGEREQFEEYVERAWRYPSARSSEYLQEAHLVVREARSESLTPIIEQRARRLEQEPDDLNNALRLAALYERDGQLRDAERIYRHYYGRAENKLAGARVLAGFYTRHGQIDAAERIVRPLLSEDRYRTGAYVLYGRLLAGTDADRAERAFRSAIESDPANPGPYSELATFLARQSDWQGAVSALEEYLQRVDEDRAAEKQLARFLIAGGEIAEAVQRLDAVLADHPDDAEALLLKGAAADEREEQAEAIALFTRAIQADPEYADAYIYRARVHLDRAELEQAREDLEAATDLVATYEARTRLARLLQEAGSPAAAARQYRNILEQHGIVPSAVRSLAFLYMNQEEWSRLESLLRDARAAQPGRVDYLQIEAAMWRRRNNRSRTVSTLAEALRMRPDALGLRRDYLGALLEDEQYDTVIERTESAEEPTLLAIRAAAMARKQQTGEAEAAFVRALKEADAQEFGFIVGQIERGFGARDAAARMETWVAARGDDWRLRSHLGVLYQRADQLTQAARLTGQAIELADDDGAKANLYRQLGVVYYRMQDYARAERAYRNSLALDPENVAALNNLAYMYTDDLDQPEEAMPLAVRAARIQPDDPNVLDTYGWTLARTGQHRRAEEVLLDALQAGAPTAVIRYHLGWVYEKLGRPRDAERQYAQALELAEPDDPVRQRVREAMDRLLAESS